MESENLPHENKWKINRFAATTTLKGCLLTVYMASSQFTFFPGHSFDNRPVV